MPKKRRFSPPKVGAIFTIPELAKRWRCHRHTVTTAIREGRLQAFKVGDRVYRIREAEVLRYEQQNMAVAS
jgi:excisionase family DNA binding protein